MVQNRTKSVTPAEKDGSWTCKRCGTKAVSARGLSGHRGGEACNAALTERSLRAAGWVPTGQKRVACEAMAAPMVYALGFVSDAKGATRRVRMLAWSRAAAVALAPYWIRLPKLHGEMRRAVADGDAAMTAFASMLALDGSTVVREKPLLY